jgi:sterol desaturase/sphingolipid hydroxylase (fatty acid hydroxylase superfamily)
MLNELKSSISLLQSYLTWFLNLSSAGLATYILALFFALLVIFEFCDPREKLSAKQLRQSYRANIELFVFNSVVMSLLAVPSLLVLAEQFAGTGLLGYVKNPIWKAIVSFLAIDLLLYFLHKASHRFDYLWMFHKVHHNDPYLNVSTAFRIHLMEIVIITVMKALLIVVLGIKGSLLLANEAVIVFFTMLHHSNISFRGEQLLGRFIITPYLHRVHHSTRRNEHDRNYGTVLSVWDRLFGTLAELKPAAIGLHEGAPHDLISLMLCGFTKAGKPVSLEAMIAEAACYLAGNRRGNGLAARSEIIRQIYGVALVRSKLAQKWHDWARMMRNILSGKNQKYLPFRKLIH